jgi:hypothetical protein
VWCRHQTNRIERRSRHRPLLLAAFFFLFPEPLWLVVYMYGASSCSPSSRSSLFFLLHWVSELVGQSMSPDYPRFVTRNQTFVGEAWGRTTTAGGVRRYFQHHHRVVGARLAVGAASIAPRSRAGAAPHGDMSRCAGPAYSLPVLPVRCEALRLPQLAGFSELGPHVASGRPGNPTYMLDRSICWVRVRRFADGAPRDTRPARFLFRVSCGAFVLMGDTHILLAHTVHSPVIWNAQPLPSTPTSVGLFEEGGQSAPHSSPHPGHSLPRPPMQKPRCSDRV